MASNFSEMVKPELVNLQLDISTPSQLFKNVAQDLQDKGFVKTSYLDALLKREQTYPTGLATEFMNVAIPHADPEHVNQPFIYIARNRKTVTFLQMGDNQELDVQNFLFLGIKNPKEQTGLLARIMELLGTDSFIKKFRQVTSNEDAYQLFHGEL
jgi:PTS system galactitol-specific IIA component